MRAEVAANNNVGAQVGATSDKRPLCPSSNCREGAQLIGIVQADGRAGLIPQALPVDADFVAKARSGRQPEKRFRFASTCLEKGCSQWTGARCGVIDKVIEALRPEAGQARPRELPACDIRSDCRWYRQAGAAACAACPQVVTDTLVEISG